MGASRSADVAGGPLDLDDEATYRRWREAKLEDYPARADDLIVEVRDPSALTPAEREALLARCRRANMAIYAGRALDADKNIPRLLGAQFGLSRLDANWLADEDGISSLELSDARRRGEYIPYTDRPLRWHTDGYYNPPERRIRAMLLHCVRSASSGGENALLDHEIAYVLLRDRSPALARALFAPDAMTIPAREDEHGVARAARTGPVFSVLDPGGALHMRYTSRTRSIEWKQDPETLAAAAFLDQLLGSDLRYVFRVRLEPGMGILCNNVLHDRSGFTQDESQRRLVYRARYLDRIRGTDRQDAPSWSAAA